MARNFSWRSTEAWFFLLNQNVPSGTSGVTAIGLWSPRNRQFPLGNNCWHGVKGFQSLAQQAVLILGMGSNVLDEHFLASASLKGAQIQEGVGQVNACPVRTQVLIRSHVVALVCRAGRDTSLLARLPPESPRSRG